MTFNNLIFLVKHDDAASFACKHPSQAKSMWACDQQTTWLLYLDREAQMNEHGLVSRDVPGN